MMHSIKKAWFIVATLVALDILQLGVRCSQEKRNTAMTIISDPVCVNRRDSRDVVFTGTGCTYPHTCPKTKPTYLISDQACISNQYIVGICGFKLVPAGRNEIADNHIGVDIENGIVSMYMGTTLFPAHVVHYNQKIGQQLSNCYIVSLEVFRGVDTFIQINHSGFTMGNNNTIQVEERLLAYNRTNYTGELYRMNIRCSNNGIFSTEDCVIFKMLSTTSIWKAKFNCAVPGTNDSTLECQLASTHRPLTETENVPDISTMDNDRNRNKATDAITNYATTEHEDRQVLYLIIGTTGSAGVLMLVAIALCCVICCQCSSDNTIHLQSGYLSDQSVHLPTLTTVTENVGDHTNTLESPGPTVTVYQSSTPGGQYNLKPNPLYGYRNTALQNPEDNIYEEIKPQTEGQT